jgi:CheY-like chemotaxis protein
MPLAKSAELILVVEDDPSTLDMTTRMLGELGYRTLTAARPDAALEMLGRTPEIALLLTDVVMPIMNGRELAEAAASIRPGIKVLFATGYTQNAIVHNGIVDAGVELIVEPFSLETLAVKVDRVLRPGTEAPR